MGLKGLLEEYKYDADFIYEGLILDISYQLKKLMEKKNMTKKQLAKKMGVKPSYITKIFSGSNISIKTIAKVLAALEIDAEILLKERKTGSLYDEDGLEKGRNIIKLGKDILEVDDEADGIFNTAA
ncbi:helix-turn-helix domain-containing protein [Hippea sp. KM1]|uniref:helix-turn-helix domain-containing protein n=1 Tax=Hippea sp. KM1 TaxID=944481 RepID=UPI00046D21D5|nr:helix-turn-helix transcriptional regulator [Hippea sp. KM1]